jgi:DNA-binding NarL/FixJ family response regulator
MVERIEVHTKPLLSPKQLEILTCMVKGMTNGEIALSLMISDQTVKNHITAVLSKLGARNRTEAVVLAICRGYVTISESKEGI